MTDFIRERVSLYSPIDKNNSVFHIIEKAKEYGAAGVEMLSFYDELTTPSLSVAKDVLSKTRSAGLVIPCFSAGATLYGEGLKSEIDKIKNFIEMAAFMEIPYMHHTIYIPFKIEEIKGDREDIFRVGIEAALELSDYAAKRGVKTIVEDQGLIFNGVKAYSRLISETEGKVGTVLDTGNIMFVDESAVDFARVFGKSIAHVHLKDYKILPSAESTAKARYKTLGGGYIGSIEIGCGDVDFRGVRAELDKVNYGGYYSIEFDKPDSISEIERTLKFIDSVFG